MTKKREKADIQYAGIAGGSLDCQSAVERLLQYRDQISLARILTSGNRHCLLLTIDAGDLVVVKSGFSSGYGGEGPRRFSHVLQLLHAHSAEIEEYEVEIGVLDRANASDLLVSDLERLDKAHPVRPTRWPEYISERDFERSREGSLWQELRPVIPFAVVDNRLIDLARSFFDDPDDRLLKGYRRLEDILRQRAGVSEHGTKLISQVFRGTPLPLTWKGIDDGEREGRINLFIGAYMAHRNPRAHRHLKTDLHEQVSEFMLLNHLFLLEREAS